MQSFQASHRLNAEALSFHCRASDVKYFNHNFFPAVLRTSQYLLLLSGSRCHHTMRKQFTLPGTIICANFSFTFVYLTLAKVLDDRITILRCKVPNFPLVSLFHTYCQRLNYIEIIFCFVAVWDIFCLYIARYRIEQFTSYHLLVWWIF